MKDGRRRQAVVRLMTILVPLAAGCGLVSTSTFFADEFLTAVGLNEQVASLPGDAPGLLVSVENRTDRWVVVVVSYRSSDDQVQTFTTTVESGGKTGQMVVCPVREITLGDVSNLSQPGARVLLADPDPENPDIESTPFIEVEAFGVLLRDEVNYNCGDGLIFTVQPSNVTRSGYQTFAFIRRAGGL